MWLRGIVHWFDINDGFAYNHSTTLTQIIPINFLRLLSLGQRIYILPLNVNILLCLSVLVLVLWISLQGGPLTRKLTSWAFHNRPLGGTIPQTPLRAYSVVLSRACEFAMSPTDCPLCPTVHIYILWNYRSVSINGLNCLQVSHCIVQSSRMRGVIRL